MATNAARYRMAAGKDIRLLEFGLRRSQGPDGGLSASKYAYMGELQQAQQTPNTPIWVSYNRHSRLQIRLHG